MKQLFVFSLNSSVIIMLLILPAIQQPPAMLEAVIALNVTLASGETIVVTSTADSGPGTFRQALLDAQSGDIIAFDPTVFPPAAPVTITLSSTFTPISALPHVSQGNLTIDASNAGVILDGSQIPGETINGLEIYSSDGNTVRGLQFVNFIGTGITLCGGSYNTIGGDRNIGTGPLGQGNLTSNNNIGIDLCSQESSASITGNLVGTDPSGTKQWGNRYCGICIENGVRDTTVGPDNIIAYNYHYGVLVDGPQAVGNTITQNSIHDNGSIGIRLKDGGNIMLDPPLIFDFDVAAGSVAGRACTNCTIEIFSESVNEGEVYEGQTKADNTDTFTLEKGISFVGPHLTATATDANGNTSEFSLPSYTLLQEGNNLARIKLQQKQSRDLEDNRVGTFISSLY
jgi:hypothetical protein